VLQYVPVWFSVFQCQCVYACVCIICKIVRVDGDVSPVVMCCSVLQCVAECSSVGVSMCACAFDAKLCV